MSEKYQNQSALVENLSLQVQWLKGKLRLYLWVKPFFEIDVSKGESDSVIDIQDNRIANKFVSIAKIKPENSKTKPKEYLFDQVFHSINNS